MIIHISDLGHIAIYATSHHCRFNTRVTFLSHRVGARTGRRYLSKSRPKKLGTMSYGAVPRIPGDGRTKVRTRQSGGLAATSNPYMIDPRTIIEKPLTGIWSGDSEKKRKNH